MSLHYETISPLLLSILKKLMSSDILKDFRLVGGTSLALQRGHRHSIDIDLFTDLQYGDMPIKDMRKYLEKTFPIYKGTETMDKDANGYHIYLSEGEMPLIKVDFFYTDPFIFPVIEKDGLRLADQREITAMKLLVIGGRTLRQKDFWDVHDMLEDYTLTEMIQWALKRDPYIVEEKDIIEGLRLIDEVQESHEGIVSLKPLEYWELKILDLKEETEKYIKKMSV